jgi:hypothetical protein
MANNGKRRLDGNRGSKKSGSQKDVESRRHKRKDERTAVRDNTMAETKLKKRQDREAKKGIHG